MSASDLSTRASRLRTVTRHVRGSVDEYARENRSQIYFQSSVQALFRLVGMESPPALSMFLEVLREYRHGPQDRKALEAAAQLLGKSRVMTPGTTEGAKKKAYELLDILDRALDAVDRVLAQGDVCEKNECALAGCFRVVNTGDFDDKTMRHALGLVERAASLVNAAGFTEICYGDAYVTQRLKRAAVLAFYMIEEDRMYVRAKPARGEETMEVETIVHELGHRLDFKFLTPEGQRLSARVFHDFTRRLDRSEIVGAKEIVVGHEFETGGHSYAVTHVVGRSTVHVRRVDKPSVTGRMGWRAFQIMEGATVSDDPFPSVYARKNENEMFAELFRACVLGTATREQREVFDRIVSLRKPMAAGAAWGRSRRRA